MNNVPLAPSLSKLFSQLTGRRVLFAVSSGASPAKTKMLYGVYTLPPTSDLLVVSADRLIIGHFGGALLGLPPKSIAERMDDYHKDEALSDAMHEIMNVAATPISPERRAVLKRVSADSKELEYNAKTILDSCAHPTMFQVSIDDVATGKFAVLN